VGSISVSFITGAEKLLAWRIAVTCHPVRGNGTPPEWVKKPSTFLLQSMDMPSETGIIVSGTRRFQPVSNES
jgi:hypothetical protein